MISTYRCIEYEDETLITFTGESSDVAALHKILGFKPMLSKKNNLVEKGYFFYLRNNKLRLVDPVLRYMQQNFQPPKVDVSIFEGNQPLPDDRSRDEWARAIETRIYNAFVEKGYPSAYGGLGHELFGKQNVMESRFSKRVKIVEGVTFRTMLTPDYYTWLLLDAVFSLMLDDEIISTYHLKKKLPDLADNIIDEYQRLTTYDTQELFQLLENFMIGITSLVTFDHGLKFTAKPASSKHLGFETSLWIKDHPPQIRVGSNAMVPLSQHVIERDLGIYEPPPIDPIFFILYPSKESRKWISLDWQVIASMFSAPIQKLLRQEIPLFYCEYEIASEDQKVVQFCETKLAEYPDKTPLFIMLGPPRPSRDCEDDALIKANDISFTLTKKLRYIKRGSYTETISWNNIEDEKSRQYSIENTLIKMLTVIGGIPWLIDNVPVERPEDQKVTAFIGIDLDSQQRVPKVAGTIFDIQGQLRGFYVSQLNPAIGDHIPEDTLIQLVKTLLYQFSQSTGNRVDHLVIHRDGRSFPDEVRILEELSDEIRTEIDLVDIKKTNQPRLYQNENQRGTPSQDLCISQEKLNLSIMSNTHVLYEMVDQKIWKFPAPRTITLDKHFGSTSMKILSSQVYLLTLSNYNSFRHTNHLPITVTYSDAFVANVRLKGGQKFFSKAVHSGDAIFWL